MKKSVVTSVKDTVKSEMKSYSKVVQNFVKTPGISLLDQSTLKTVVKNYVAEEDRSQT